MKIHHFLNRTLPAAALAALLLAGSAFAAGAYVASDMRLASAEGTVTVTNSNGRRMPNVTNMKLQNGSRITTDAASYANISLDAAKLVKLDEKSEAGITTDGKNLELTLDAGSVYFNVTEPLPADETFHIKTSTMITGIRGTSGIVTVINDKHSQVTIFDGEVESEVTDPISGETKRETLGAGNTADFYVYDPQKEGDKTDIILHRTTEEDISGFAGTAILSDDGVMERMRAEGLDVEGLTRNAEQKLSDAQQQALSSVPEQSGGSSVVENGVIIATGVRYVSYSGNAGVTPEQAGSDPFYYESDSDEIDSHIHSWTSSYLAEPSCEKGGTMLYTCSTCGEEQTREVPALGHKFRVERHFWDSGSDTIYEEVECERCGTIDSRDAGDASRYSGHVWATQDNVRYCSICEYPG